MSLYHPHPHPPVLASATSLVCPMESVSVTNSFEDMKIDKIDKIDTNLI